MNADISKILREWDYQENALIVRKIVGDDGKDKIQIRINLGILQMEAEGRPDGQTPHNSSSLLKYYTGIIDKYKRDYGNNIEDFALTEQDMRDLDMEIMQYYHRRICFFALKDYTLAKMDAEHNLMLMDIIRKYSRNSDYVESHERFRPLVIMERARAAGLESIDKGDYASAMKRISEAIDMIETFYRENGVSENNASKSRELRILLKWRNQIHQEWEGGVSEELDDDYEDEYDNDEFDDF